MEFIYTITTLIFKNSPNKFLEDNKLVCVNSIRLQIFNNINNLSKMVADKKNLLKVIHIGFSFFFLSTAFNTWQNIVSEAYDQNDYGALGFYSLAVLYISFAIGSFFSAPVIEKLGSRNCIKIGGLWYLIWVASGILPVTIPQTPTVKVIIWTVMVCTGSINGFGASIYWVGQGKYVTDCWNTT